MQTANATHFLCAENALASKNYFGKKGFLFIRELIYSVTTVILVQKFNRGVTRVTPLWN